MSAAGIVEKVRAVVSDEGLHVGDFAYDFSRFFITRPDGQSWLCWLHRAHDGWHASWSFHRGARILNPVVASGEWLGDDETAAAIAAALLLDHEAWSR